MRADDDKKGKVLPIRKQDARCYGGGGMVNALFLIQVGLMSDDEDLEKDLATELVESLAELFERYQDDNLHAEMIYKTLKNASSLMDTFYSEATVCPKCGSFNIAVEETDEETHNQCLDCNNSFIAE
jgi:NADH pyrophosphatase NudC (nudix superfamily)